MNEAEKDKDEKEVTGHAQRMIYPLPCLFTSASLLSGFYAIISSINGNFFNAAMAIIVAGIFDGLDGRVARLTKTTSIFGMEFDSLSDLVSFGVAPALLAYLWALEPFGRYGWLAAFLYVATTALRLARFNSLTLDKAPKDFVGLPCPAAAGMIATTVLFSRYLGATETVKHVSIVLLVYLLSYLMVSNIRYVSFKHPAAKRKKTFQVTVGMVLLLILVAAEPPVTLFVIGLVYVLSGPLSAVYRKMHRSEKVVEEQENTI
ncbi:MAG: CDP-diacylglycerol--serine O-phosphatidyltransferase [Desulfobulbales bacterium]